MLVFTKKEVQEAVVAIYDYSIQGYTDAEIMDEMGLEAEDYRGLKAAMFETKAEAIRQRPVEHVYVQYIIDQCRNVQDLDDMIEAFKTSRQYNAFVGAIRVRSEIIDKIIDKGQSFGLISKEPDKQQIIAGVFVADLTSKDLKKAITTELKHLDGMMKRYGDKSIIELAPGPAHLGPKLRSKSTPSEVSEGKPSKKKSKKKRAKVKVRASDG